jgi:hypothetical protein
MKYDVPHRRAIQYAAADAGALWIAEGYETVSDVILKPAKRASRRIAVGFGPAAVPRCGDGALRRVHQDKDCCTKGGPL